MNMNSSTKELRTTRIFSIGRVHAIEPLKVELPDMSMFGSELSQSDGERDVQSDNTKIQMNSPLNPTDAATVLPLPTVTDGITPQPMHNT